MAPGCASRYFLLEIYSRGSLMIYSHQIVATYFEQGRYSEAEELCVDALVNLDKLGATYHIDLISIEQSLACIHFAQGDYKRAEQQYAKAYEAMLSYDSPHPAMAVLLTNFAALKATIGQFPSARTMLSQAISILEAHPNLTEEMSAAISGLAECYWRSGELDEAKELLKRSIEFAEVNSGSNSVAISLNNMARFLIANNRFDDAEPFLRRALELMDPGHRDYPALLNNLAFVFNARRNFAASAQVLSRALRLLQLSGRGADPIIATITSNIATLDPESGTLDQIEALYRQALSVLHNSIGLQHPDCAILLSNLARVHIHRNNLSAAADLLQWASDILADVGCADIAIHEVLLGMAAVCYARLEFSEAELLYKSVLASFENTRSTETAPGYLIGLAQLAVLYHRWNRSDERDAVLDTALHLLDHSDLAQSDTANVDTIETLADLSFACKKYQQAKALYARAEAASTAPADRSVLCQQFNCNSPGLTGSSKL